MVEGRRFRTRTLAIGAALSALVGVAAVVIPSSAAGPPTEVRLHLGSDGRYFAYGSTLQPLSTAKNGCQITSAEPLIDLSSTGSQSAPGLGPDSIGVKRSPSSSNGTPCSQVDGPESLNLAPGASLGGRQFSGVRLDLEMTGNALVQLTFSAGSTSATYRLQTGSSITTDQTGEAGYDTSAPYFVSSAPGDELDACASPQSSGPNSSGNDNCQWTVRPGFDFDSITLSTTIGTVALEGAGDFGNKPAFETLLYLANRAPTATSDSYSTDEDVTLQGNVLSNDADADGHTLTAAVVSGPSDGTLDLSSDGGFTYVPDPDWSGSDSFVYQASDGITDSNATVTITVRPVNDRPVAENDSATTPEETSVTVTVATDVDSTDLSASCTSSDGGSIVDNGDGTVSFTPPLNFNGTITLTCTVTDDAGATTASSSTVSVGVTAVNDAPVAAGDTAEVDAGDSVVIDVLANDSDVDGDPLTVTAITLVTPSDATAVANADGTVTYTPPAGYTGAGSFTYRASDGTASSGVAEVDVTVFPVMCSRDSVSDSDGDVTGTFTRLSDPFECKRYTIDAVESDESILFLPQGGAEVAYRGVLSFGPDPAPGGTGEYQLLLRYDPTGGDTLQPMRWCIDPEFDGDDMVTSARLPPGETWCVASAVTRPNIDGDLETVWQVYGLDDPKITR